MGKMEKNMLVVCDLVFGSVTFMNGALLGITSYGGYFQINQPILFNELVKLFLVFRKR